VEVRQVKSTVRWKEKEEYSIFIIHLIYTNLRKEEVLICRTKILFILFCFSVSSFFFAFSLTKQTKLAIRQAIAKSIVAFYQKYVDEAAKKEIRATLVAYDRTLLVADPRRCEPKKFGGAGARAR